MVVLHKFEFECGDNFACDAITFKNFVILATCSSKLIAFDLTKDFAQTNIPMDR